MDDGDIVRLATTMDRVGIGTSAPLMPLHIDAHAGTSALRLERTDVSPGVYDFVLSDATPGGDSNVNSLVLEAMRPGSGFALYPKNAAGDFISAVVVTSDGDVGIGTESPQARLDVAGSMRVGGGSVVHGIQYGTAGDHVGGTGGTSVTFPQSFASTPMVQLTVDESDNNLGATGCRLTAVSATGFTFWCFEGTADHEAYRVHWLAIG